MPKKGSKVKKEVKPEHQIPEELLTSPDVTISISRGRTRSQNYDSDRYDLGITVTGHIKDLVKLTKAVQKEIETQLDAHMGISVMNKKICECLDTGKKAQAGAEKAIAEIEKGIGAIEEFSNNLTQEAEVGASLEDLSSPVPTDLVTTHGIPDEF